MATSAGKISIVALDDDPDVLVAVRLALADSLGAVLCVDSAARLLDAVREHAPVAVLIDMNFTTGATSGAEGLELSGQLAQLDPSLSVVLMTAFGSVSLAVDALKQGAADFVLKPWSNEKLLATMNAAANLTRARRETRQLQRRNRALAECTHTGASHIIGQSAAIRAVLDVARRAAPADASVLLLGESGTGKELTAREIHRLSPRATLPFIAVDLGAIPETLFESELFGHRRGAFSGAVSDRVGLIEAADTGTLFLDEIGNLPLHLQAKLLAALERREVCPVGDTRPRAVDLRLITATNRSREELHEEENFRRDLLYRINTVEIQLPALRDRRDDIPLLSDHYIALYARKYGVRQRRVGLAALQSLLRYDWPGNIRELSHQIERATILALGDEFEVADFSLVPAARTVPTEDSNLESLEKRTVARALERAAGNVSHAAVALGITRTALYRRMSKHGL